jgi:L-alanine-DL-glutamate epimerase-like enolase superfamily enzyme
MEIHISLAAAVPNGLYVEHIPQLRGITHTQMTIENGNAIAPTTPGLGIDWNFAAIEGLRVS